MKGRYVVGQTGWECLGLVLAVTELRCCFTEKVGHEIACNGSLRTQRRLDPRSPAIWRGSFGGVRLGTTASTSYPTLTCDFPHSHLPAIASLIAAAGNSQIRH